MGVDLADGVGMRADCRAGDGAGIPGGVGVEKAAGAMGADFYVIESGEVEFSIDDRIVRTEGAGAFFGEIALLRDIPRTASVRAVTDVQLLALARDPFVEAVTGQAASRRTAESLVAERIGA